MESPGLHLLIELKGRPKPQEKLTNQPITMDDALLTLCTTDPRRRHLCCVGSCSNLPSVTCKERIKHYLGLNNVFLLEISRETKEKP